MKQFVSQYVLHWMMAGGAALLASKAARALPPPVPMGSRLYTFCYNFAQALLANDDKKS